MVRGVLAALVMSTGLSGAVMAGTVSGTISNVKPADLPEHSVLDVRLVDISRQDVAAEVLSSKRYKVEALPAAFALEYDDALIDDRMSYAIQAQILNDGTLLFTNTSVVPVLARGATDSVEVEVFPILNDLSAGKWQAYEMQGDALDGPRLPEIEFAGEGRFGATGGCNRFMGSVEVEPELTGGKVSFPSEMAGTLMACPPDLDTQERAFLKTLAGIVAFDRSGEELSFMDEAGEIVLRLRLVR